jgi:hypothetical protein
MGKFWSALTKKRLMVGDDSVFIQDVETQHSEADWAAPFPEALPKLQTHLKGN